MRPTPWGTTPARASEHPALDQGGPPTSARCATAGCRRSAPPLPPRCLPGPDRRVLDVGVREAVAVGGQRLDRAEVAEGAGRPRAVRADRPVCEEPAARPVEAEAARRERVTLGTRGGRRARAVG